MHTPCQGQTDPVPFLLCTLPSELRRPAETDSSRLDASPRGALRPYADENGEVGTAPAWTRRNVSQAETGSLAVMPPQTRPISRIPNNAYGAMQQILNPTTASSAASLGPILPWSASVVSQREPNEAAQLHLSLEVLAGPELLEPGTSTLYMVCRWNQRAILVAVSIASAAASRWWLLEQPAFEAADASNLQRVSQISPRDQQTPAHMHGKRVSSASAAPLHVHSSPGASCEAQTQSVMESSSSGRVFTAADCSAAAAAVAAAPRPVWDACFVPSGQTADASALQKAPASVDEQQEMDLISTTTSPATAVATHWLWIAYEQGILACFRVPALETGALLSTLTHSNEACTSSSIGGVASVQAHLWGRDTYHRVPNADQGQTAAWTEDRCALNASAKGLVSVSHPDGSVLVLDTIALVTAVGDVPDSTDACDTATAWVHEWSLPQKARSTWISAHWIAHLPDTVQQGQQSRSDGAGASRFYVITAGRSPAVGVWAAPCPSRGARAAATAYKLAKKWQQQAKRLIKNLPYQWHWDRNAALQLGSTGQRTRCPADSRVQGPGPDAGIRAMFSKNEQLPAAASSQGAPGTSTGAVDPETLDTSMRMGSHHGHHFSGTDCAEQVDLKTAPADFSLVYHPALIQRPREHHRAMYHSQRFLEWVPQRETLRLERAFDDNGSHHVVQCARWSNRRRAGGVSWLLAVDRAGRVLVFYASDRALYPIYLHKAVPAVHVAWIEHVVVESPERLQGSDGTKTQADIIAVPSRTPRFLTLSAQRGLLSLFALGEPETPSPERSSNRRRSGLPRPWVRRVASWQVPRDARLLPGGTLLMPDGGLVVWHKLSRRAKDSAPHPLSEQESVVSFEARAQETASSAARGPLVVNRMPGRTATPGDSVIPGTFAQARTTTIDLPSALPFGPENDVPDAVSPMRSVSSKDGTRESHERSPALSARAWLRSVLPEYVMKMIEQKRGQLQLQGLLEKQAPEAATAAPMETASPPEVILCSERAHDGACNESMSKAEHLSQTIDAILVSLEDAKEERDSLPSTLEAHSDAKQSGLEAVGDATGHRTPPSLTCWLERVHLLLWELITATEWLPCAWDSIDKRALAEIVATTVNRAWIRWEVLVHEHLNDAWPRSWILFWRQAEYVEALALWYASLTKTSAVCVHGTLRFLDKNPGHASSAPDTIPTFHQVLETFEIRWSTAPAPGASLILMLHREKWQSALPETRWIETALASALVPNDANRQVHNMTTMTTNAGHTPVPGIDAEALLATGLSTVDVAFLVIRVIFQTFLEGSRTRSQRRCAPFRYGTDVDRTLSGGDALRMRHALEGFVQDTWLHPMQRIWQTFWAESAAVPMLHAPSTMDTLFFDAILHNPPIPGATALHILYSVVRGHDPLTRTAASIAPRGSARGVSVLWMQKLHDVVEWAFCSWFAAQQLLRPFLDHEHAWLVDDWSVFRWNTCFGGPVLPLHDNCDRWKAAKAPGHIDDRSDEAGCGNSPAALRSGTAHWGDAVYVAETRDAMHRALGISLRLAMGHDVRVALALLRHLDTAKLPMTIADDDLVELVRIARAQLALAIREQPERSALLRLAVSGEVFAWMQRDAEHCATEHPCIQDWSIWFSVTEALAAFAADQTSELVVRLVQLASCFAVLAHPQ